MASMTNRYPSTLADASTADRLGILLTARHHRLLRLANTISGTTKLSAPSLARTLVNVTTAAKLGKSYVSLATDTH